MTRLRSDKVRSIPERLKSYDHYLLQVTGSTLRQIAARAAGIEEDELLNVLGSSPVAVIPVTWGQGVIQGFSRAVCSIAGYLGFQSFVTEATNLAGLEEAIQRQADIVILGDDDTFLAINLVSRRVVENSDATGRGYVAALTSMLGTLQGCEVLVIGLGSVGRSTVGALRRAGARVAVYDIDPVKTRAWQEDPGVRVERDLEEALTRYRIFFDASPAERLIHPEHIKPDTVIAAPGVPLGLSPGALSMVQDRLIHDYLEIGVATMLVDSVTTK